MYNEEELSPDLRTVMESLRPYIDRDKPEVVQADKKAEPSRAMWAMMEFLSPYVDGGEPSAARDEIDMVFLYRSLPNDAWRRLWLDFSGGITEMYFQLLEKES